MTVPSTLNASTSGRRLDPRRRFGQVVWTMGWPARVLLLGVIRVYRVALGPALGGGCRFYPSCSHYAEGAIRARGVLVGTVLAAWRLLRCHPWSRGGLDPPPDRRGPKYEAIIRPTGAA